MNDAVAVPLALGAAGTFALSSVLQQRAARTAPRADALSPRLIVDLVAQPAWLTGMGCVVVAYALQAIALAFGPIALVEPLVALELALALPLASRLRRRRLGLAESVGALAVVVGVAVFLLSSAPHGGDAEPSLVRWALVSVPVLFVASAAVLGASGPESPRRAALLALGAGLCFGLLALITQSFVVECRSGIAAALSSWQPYVLCALGIVAFTVVQSAYQAGPLALSLPIVDSLEPIGAVVLAALAFSEHVDSSPASLCFELGGGLCAVVGLVLLGRSPLVRSVYAPEPDR